ncbi:murein biosynthesis integral membrane protein MurJ [Poseidonibacter ostreae]|jgi:putative peptidoglycan lipid II flippase|uniref:Probable lipid II flippase MurJ n=1 Tax=Poseidonibacter ostreae TaxID=2654171 RepID=A0A6L4WNV9_9BACT|nr:murein biosynthesis integral membrane protein MurJ [Poseidonibacter ostreae]KAB7885362.1 murein biosynthesis integral membrane protein MurJ [Poseidonibacter ostreae]KAB7885771.1 murein biosynthesis integral membrane protein MurJ [Poseidonibacter ostreae]KAB7892999.1 murein biosynthesis integral membrane protein MurJ [Poseidonibacter ostreae]MAC85128.1 murein biosynthesis integral membrane protein MurJ [Arcobacter sp.]|tara:strand:- start:1895 stop:3196 length:1302 start_codon:yes stop_codon:yes gene_type:complete
MLLKSIFTNSTGILTSRILGFIRDLLTASILGANIYSDIFFVAFKLPNLFRRIFAEGAFTQAFIPAYAKSNHKIRFSSVVFLQLFGFLIILSLLVSLFSSLVAKAVAIGFDQETIDLAAPLFAINFYYLPMIFIVTFMAALLQYKNHFATTAYSTALLNLTMITALLISQNMEKYEITFYLSYGVLAGGLLQILVHLYAIKRLNLCKIFHFKKHKKKEENKFYKNFMSATVGSSTTHLSAFIDTWLASFLMTGSISYLYYGNRVFQLPLALFAIATSVALFPMIARSIKNKDENKALALMKKSSLILLGLLSISTFIGIFFNEFIISLLFERGAFTSTDTTNTALILSMYLIGLIPFGIGKIFSLWLYAKEQQFLAAKISVYSLGWNIVFSLLLIQPFGAAGLAFASTLSGFILFFLTIKAFGFQKFIVMFKK